MPQNNNQQKKKKGHAPAHQNKFAFKHNAKSKTTAKILASRNVHVCRRCHDKIEWRKQYRKYKPRTQPGTCNECKKRNVLAAYHTICDSCTKNSVKAKELIRAELEGKQTAKEEPEKIDESHQTSEEHISDSILRVCAMCVKEIALPDPDDEVDEEVAHTGRLRLRERKALERKLEKESMPKKGESTENDATTEGDVTGDGLEAMSEEDDGNNEDDPFLQAVGGSDKLLTGTAYQEKLLAQQGQIDNANQ